FLIENRDEFLQQLQMFGAGDGVDLLQDAALPLDEGNEMLDSGGGERTARALKRQQLVDLFSGELSSPVGLALDPGHDLWLGGLFVEAAEMLVGVGGRAAIGLRQQLLERSGAQV